ncbi:MAG: 16S rRNA (guanine(527)-N(7))-methyltransferase RsmG, partial [Isosphaeraceae bacterium]
MSPSRSSLQVLIERCGLSLTPAQYDQLWTYHQMLRAANAELNLTRIHNFENMVLKHYVDSLLVLTFIDLPTPLIDMGSGPGLPGIPLKIARPGVSMILAEPRGARAEFLETVRDRLKLDDLEIHAGKIGPRYPRKVAGIITRAVASIPETLDRVAHCLDLGGRMLFMKGPDCHDEIARARESHAESFRMVADHAYQIPGTEHARRLVIYERLAGETATSVSVPTYAGPIRDLTSESNPAFRAARDLLSGRGIRKHGQALIAWPRL